MAVREGGGEGGCIGLDHESVRHAVNCFCFFVLMVNQQREIMMTI